MVLYKKQRTLSFGPPQSAFGDTLHLWVMNCGDSDHLEMLQNTRTYRQDSGNVSAT